MEWLLLTAAGAVVAWTVEKLLDRLLDAWRARGAQPLTDKQAQRRKRWRFALAVACLLYVAVVLGLLLAGIAVAGAGWNEGLVAAALFALLVYLWRVVRRRYARL